MSLTCLMSYLGDEEEGLVLLGLSLLIKRSSYTMNASSGLDPHYIRNSGMLIRGMQEQLGCTSIVVTHDMQSAFYVADRIALLIRENS